MEYLQTVVKIRSTNTSRLLIDVYILQVQ